jgi:tetratricopeptide (TPR) repeat protein
VILLFLIFHFAMLAGIVLLGVYWMAGGGRYLPAAVVFPFLLGLPLAGWLLGTVVWGPVILVVPASLAVACAWSFRGWRADRMLQRAGRAEKLLAAERQIAEDPENAGARVARAEVLEDDGRFAEARAEYERAFGASDRALSRYRLKDHLERLEHAEKASAARGELGGKGFARYARRMRFEWVLVLAGAAVAAASPAHGAAVASLGLTAVWLRKISA